MLRVKTVLIGSLLVMWQLGCGSESQKKPALVPSPQPDISISPASAIVGSTDLTITITASGTFQFLGGINNKVLWSANGSDTELSSTLVSSSLLTAIIPAMLLASPLQAQLRVEKWDHIEGAIVGTSGSVPFNVTPTPIPVPSISSISPSTVAAGSPDVEITIEGANFGHFRHFVWSTAFWTTSGNLHDTGNWLQTSIISSTQLRAVIPAKLLQNPASVQIIVMNGDVMSMSDGYFGYPGSNSVTFTVTP